MRVGHKVRGGDIKGGGGGGKGEGLVRGRGMEEGL